MKYCLIALLCAIAVHNSFSQTATLTAIYSGSTTAITKVAGDMDNISDGGSRAFMKFDLSSLPGSAVITSATLEYHNYGGTGGSGISNSIFAVSSDPVTSSASNLYADCGDVSPMSGNIGAAVWTMGIPVTYNTTLNTAGITFLNANIGAYASLSLVRDAGGTNTYNFRGYTNTTNPPKLQVNYYIPVACNTAPTPGNVITTNQFPCTGESVTLSLNGTSVNTGLGFQWQQAATGSGSWSNIGGATNPVHTFNATTDFDYRCVVTCISTSNDSISDSVSLKVGGISTFPYHQNFEITNGGWRGVDLGGGLNEWLWGTPGKTKINGAASGQYCWSTNLVSDYRDLMNYALESPCFDFTNMPVPRLSFSMRYVTEVDYDGLFLETSTNGGATWVKVPASYIILNTYNSNSTIAAFTPPAWCGDNGGWLRYVVFLPNLGGVSAAKIRVHFQSDNFVTDEGVGFDSVSITNTFKDVTVLSLTAPVNACSPPGNVSVRANLANFGLTLNSGTKIPVSYRLNNGTVYTDTILLSSNKIIGDTIPVTFTVPASLTSFGTYTFKIWVSLPGDSDQFNDTLIKAVSIISVTSLPYRENFENSDGGWSCKMVTGSFADFTWGTPSKIFISGAASGNKCWVTKTTSNYEDFSDYALESPCINLLGSSSPSLEFSLNYSTELDFDGCILESSTNGGASWTKVTGFTKGDYNNNSNLGVFPPPQWSGKSGGWQRVKVSIASMAGQSNVKFRLHFGSDLSATDEGVAIDSFTITDIYSKDVGVAGVISPVSGCGLTSTTPVTVKVRNYGKQLPSGTKIPLAFKLVDFNNIIMSLGTDTVTLTAPLNLNDSVVHTFTPTLNLGLPGFYIFKSWTVMLNDSDRINDTLHNFPIISRASILSYPYSENFEVTDGTWYAETLKGTTTNEWGWNFPVKPVINATPNGQQCWLTNPFNNYANNTDNALYSPCFNFSLMVNPEMSFFMRFKMQPNNDGMVLESSINGGLSWQRVDSSNQQSTYNNTITGGGITPPKWSGDNTSWTRYYINVAHLAAQSNVQFRFRFNSDATINDEGAAIDSFVIRDNVYDDLNLMSVISPISKCGMTANEQVSVLLRNQGNIVIPSGTIIPMTYIINGGAPVTENFTFPITLGPNETIRYDFTATAALNTGGAFSFSFYCYHPYDINRANDSVHNYIVSAKTAITSYPYFENFGGGASEWFASGGRESWRISSLMNNPSLGAYSPTEMGVFNADSFLMNASSKFISPCLDFGTLTTHATLSFYMAFNNLEPLNKDSLYVLITNNDGASWDRLLSISRYNSVYTTPQWGRVDVDLSAYSGQPSLLIAFEAIGKQGTNFAIDDVHIYNSDLRSQTGTYALTSSCPVTGGNQWIDLRDDKNNLIAQVNPNGNNLGSMCYGLNVVTDKLRSERVGTFPNRQDHYYFVRNLWLQSSIAPSSPVGVRLFYNGSDFDLTHDSISNRIGTSITKTNLDVMNYRNSTTPDDLDPLNNNYATGVVTYLAQKDTSITGFSTFSFTTTTLGEFSPVYRKQVVGIANNSVRTSLALYPNPAGSVLHVRLDGVDATGYVVFNAIGQVIMEGDLNAGESKLNISALAQGVYVLKAGNESMRFMKE